MGTEGIAWGENKDELLRSKFGFGFERVVEAIDQGAVLAIRDHPNRIQYPHQKQMIIKIDGYAWVVPYVMRDDGIFLKTMFPSSVETKTYLGGLQ